ncbi:hypothetical protein [Reyranella sp.]|uniref:hypothetical protein n=1 Tax=Reyranella sp. TaxID=1929291 RepID=UPI003BA8E25C
MPAVKLSFAELISEGVGGFFANVRLFFHLVTIPWILSIAIRAVGELLTDDSPLSVLAEKAADVFPTVMFMVAWQRVILLGPHRLERLPGLGWSPRETAYLLHLIKVAGMTFLLVAAFIYTVWPLDPQALRAGAGADPEMARRYSLAGPLAGGFIVSMLLALRVSWGLAATAVDVPFAPRQSWAYSRGNAWTIVGALFLTYFAGAFATGMTALFVHGAMRGLFGAREAAAVVSWTAAILVSYAATGVTVSVQAVIFRRLLAWREGSSLPAVAGSQ